MIVLINAYACSPIGGSEPGMAWNWILNLSKHCRLIVITEGEWKNEIEDYLVKHNLNDRIKFYYNPLPDKIRKICWNQGDWRFYFYYQKWQKKTLEIAKIIIRDYDIAIVHQLNMIGFREPGFLYKLDKPLVWGPVDAKENFPVSYLEGSYLKTKLFIILKNSITKFQLNHSKRLRKVIDKSSIIISASSNSKNTLQKYFGINSIVINETGCNINKKQHFGLKNENSPLFNLLWVGKFDFRKQLIIALKAVEYSKNRMNIRIHIVGGEESENQKFMIIAKKIGIAQNCIWYGKIPHYEVQKLMRECDVFFFTSVAEGTPHVVLEAISNNLPVLCFNTCGQGDSVNEQIGIKIELTNPDRSNKEFAKKIDYLIDNNGILERMKENCDKRQKELSWDNKSKEMMAIYQNILQAKQNSYLKTINN